MTKALLETLILMVLFSATLPAESEGTPKSPNLIVIMVDDMGYADVGFNGCEDIPTPHIDSIAAGGVKFTSGYVAYAVCGPSRASFITGRYGQRFGFERNPQYQPSDPNMGVPIEETTIADALQEVGYHSGVIGKWHLGAHEVLHPLSRGFDEFYGHLGGGHRYLPEELTIQDSYEAKGESESYQTWILRNREPVQPTKYLTDEFSDEAVSFIDRNHAKPFFLYLAYNAPHLPLQATEKYLARFPDLEGKRKIYAAMVSAVDDGVGRVLESLRKNQIEDDTLVFFLSDNGGPETKNASDNGPLRGDKGSVYEGGHRVPFAAKWPARFPKGVVYDQPVISLDIFGTIAALSGAPTDPERPLDGVNLTPYVTGERSGRPHEATYMRKFDSGSFIVRSGDHKLVIPGRDEKAQLYNVTTDIGETTNLAYKDSDIRDQLKNKLDAWTDELIEPRFLGLIHTEAFQKKNQKANGKQK
ncbi:sulfatase-like hydrolase/transferase [Aporhodopirellula aestuarii]|uniref:Sulfatase-like hydrolase/transferase n=1 Tax=Aporhodopirellula aestuarii TaxID=2950107 RepID=A0ABT0U6W4_9BACT|nr:sulfatase-like hydrolase/transferase [Aporhodopirellula aestuarii]MCM2372645.1 sulfatase-like hydrolase/transferase [Aporhodopirellula aestuarii]